MMGKWSMCFAFFLIVSISLYACYIAKYINEYDSLVTYQYSWIVESNAFLENYDKLKKSENILSVYNKNGKGANANIYFFNIDENITVFDFELDDKEIVISQKAARALDIGVGDIVTIDLPIFYDKQEYVVKEIWGYCSDYYNVKENIDFSTVIIGCNRDIIEQIEGHNVYFLSDEEFIEFTDKDYSYLGRYNKHNDIEYLRKRIIVGGLLENILFGALLIVLGSLIFHNIDIEINKFYLDGYQLKLVNLYRIVDRLIFYFIPIMIYVIAVLICLFLKLISSQMMLATIIFVVISILCTLLIGRRRYERVN